MNPLNSKKTALSQQGKAERLSLDAYMEDAQLINHVQTAQELDSRKEALHVICNQFRGSEETEKQKCQHLCGEYCSKNAEKIKKVDASYCQACLKAQRISQKEIDERRTSFAEALNLWKMEYDFFKRLGVPVEKNHDKVTWISLANGILDKQSAEIAPLETDNEFLKLQIEELKHDPIAEKNALLTVQMAQKDQEIKGLKAEIEKQEATINAYMFQRQTIEKP